MALLILAILAFTAGTAMADSIGGRFGVTGRAGGLVPVGDPLISSTSESKTGFVGGGGLIFGLGSCFDADVEVLHSPQLNTEIGGVKVAEAQLTDIAIGIHYRIMPNNRLVPYIGGGADFIKGDVSFTSGNTYGLDWTYGGHANAGIDFFLNKSIALNLDFRGLFAVKGDITRGDVVVGEYDPMSFIGTVGIRLILPEKL
ncbi:MAG TPA: outer membrane beta-barrel protein [Geobacteraceae bacterium]